VLAGGDGFVFTFPYPINDQLSDISMIPLESQEHISSVTELPPLPNGHDDFLVVTTSRAFITSGNGPDFGSQASLSRDIPDNYHRRWTKASRTGQTVDTISLADDVGPDTKMSMVLCSTTVDMTNGEQQPTAFTLDPVQVAYSAFVYTLQGTGTREVATLEPRTAGGTEIVIRLYTDLTMQSADHLAAATVLETADNVGGYDMIAVGDFFTAPGEEIIIASAGREDVPPLCYHRVGNSLVLCQ
jgi:hypothetical protein